MAQIVKVWLGIFLTFLFVAAVTGCISAGMDINRAKDYKADVITNLENSNYNADVINACIATAIEHDYELEIVTYDRNGNINTYAAGAPAGKTDEVYTANVIMKYKYSIDFMNVNSEKTLRGIAK